MAQKTPRHHNKQPIKSKKNNVQEILDTAMTIAADKGWSGVTLKFVAEKTRLPIWAVAEHFPHASDILYRQLEQMTAKVEQDCRPYMSDNWRENLTEVLMQRFDLANQHRAAFKSLFHFVQHDPIAGLAFAPMLFSTMKSMLKLARLPVADTTLDYISVPFAGFYLWILKTWHEDDSRDLTLTMAAIDRRLNTFQGLLDMSGLLNRQTDRHA